MLRRMQVLVAIAAAAVAVVAGCTSDSSSPVAPEDNAPPAAVTALSASVHATNDPTVTLSWNPGVEPDLVGYRIYRTEGRDATGASKRGTSRLTANPVVELTGTAFVDDTVIIGESYSYSVTAVDNAGNESARALSVVLVAPPGEREDQNGVH